MQNQIEVAARAAGFITGAAVMLFIVAFIGPASSPSLRAAKLPPSPITASAVPDKTGARPLTAIAAPQTPSIKASFEVLETVSASGRMDREQRDALDKFAWPPLSFKWSGPPQSLAPAFLWQDGEGGFHLGARPLPEGPEGETLLGNFSTRLAIRFKAGTGQLRLHYNVIARLKAWVQEIGPDLGKAAPVEVRIETPTPDRVLLKVPAIGKTPARTFVVGV